MNTLIEDLCKNGTVSFDLSDKGCSIIFEPLSSNSLPDNMQNSTVLIVRSCPIEAVAALNQYITSKKHWSEYPESFWDTISRN